MFDPKQLLEETVDAPNATEYQQLAEGEYTATTGEITEDSLKEVETKNGPKMILTVPFIIRDQEINKAMDREQIIHREDFWLDLEENGKLSTGPDKNINLGRLKKALNQNLPGWTFRHLANQGPLRIAIKHRTDKNDPSKKYVNAVKFAALT